MGNAKFPRAKASELADQIVERVFPPVKGNVRNFTQVSRNEVRGVVIEAYVNAWLEALDDGGE